MENDLSRVGKSYSPALPTLLYMHSPSKFYTFLKSFRHMLSFLRSFLCRTEHSEALASKLGHGIFEVRLRSASNLLFKLKNKVIDQDTLKLPMAVKMVASGVLEGLQLFKLSEVESYTKADDADSNNVNARQTAPNTKIENNEFLAVLLKILIHIVKNSEYVDPKDLSEILDQLMAIADKEGDVKDQRLPMLSDLKALLEESITAITSVKIDSNDRRRNEKYEGSIDEDGMEMDALPHMTAVDDITTNDDYYQGTIEKSDLSQYHQNSDTFQIFKANAGVILDSKLCTDGFKFPHTILTDVDEKFLFDVDVKLKLDEQKLHDSRLLFDMLVNYPVSVILSRKTLLAHVLDCIGAALFTADKNYNQPLSPMEAIDWMIEFLKKAERAFTALLDGSICACVPKAYEDATIDMYVDEGIHDPNSLSMQLAVNMYKMRVPIVPFENNGATVTSSSKLAAIVTERIPPSLPGIAFAACAAALPLLKLRSTILCERVYRLLTTALPLIFEPDLHVFDAPNRSLCPLDLVRLQHLLKRCGQIVEFHHYQPFALFNSRDGGILHCDLIIANVLVMILDLIPKDPAEIAVTPQLNIEESLKVYLLSVCCSHKLIQTKVSFLEKAKIVLCALCPTKAYDVKEANESLIAVDRLISITEDPWKVRNNPDMLMTDSFLSDLLRSLSVLENASHDIENENILSAVLVSLEALISLEDENILMQVSSMLERLLIVCGQRSRKATIDFIVSTNNQALFITLATPTVVAALITQEVLSDPISQKSLNKNALKIIETLLSETLVLSDEVNIAQPNGQIDSLLCDWCDLLTPLKLVAWIPSINQSWPIIEIFTDRLEDLCSQLTALNDQYFRHLVTGVFHADVNVRASCSTRLRHHFQFPGDIIDSDNAADIVGDKDSSYTSVADPFFKRLKLYSSSSSFPFFKSTLFEGTTVTNTRTTLPSIDIGESIFEHKDIRKLADIALLSDFDVVIRLSAMHQLVSIVSADKHLVRTIEKPWCMKVVNASLSIISEMSDGVLNASLTQEEKDLVSLSLTFIALLIQSCREVRQAVDFNHASNDVADQESSIGMNILLKIFLSAYSSPSNVVTDYFDCVWCKCGIILSSVILHVDIWEVSDAYTYRTSRQVKADDIVLVTPSYLLSLFISIGMSEDNINYDSSSGDDGIEIFRAAVVPAIPVATNSVTTENSNMLTSVLDKSCDENLTSMAVHVVLTVNDAQSSQDLLNAISAANSFVTMYSFEALSCLLEEGLMTALYKYLNTCPTNSKDLYILTAILNVLGDFIDKGMKNVEMNKSEGMRHMIDSVLDSLVGPLSPLLACGKGEHPNKAKYYLQSALISIFTVIIHHEPSKDSIADFLIDSSMSVVLGEILVNEATAPSLRNISGNALQLLIMKGFTTLRDNMSISAPHSRPMGLRAPFDDIISLSKLLRPPDALKYTSSLVSSLKILFVALSVGGSVISGRDWKFITRYVYDRRGEVRLLALEIMDFILNEGEELLKSKDDDDTDTTPSAILLRILLDPSEAQAVRYKAGALYVKYYAQSSVDMELGQLFRGLFDGVNNPSSTPCTSFGMMKMAMLVSSLLSSTIREGDYNTSTILDILTPLKGIQTIVSLLAPDVVFRQAEAALNRVGYHSMDLNEESSTYSFEQTSKYLVPEIERSLLNIPFEHTGYQKIWTEVKIKAYTRLLEFRTHAIGALISASSLYPSLFADLIRNTTLVRNIVSCISKVYIIPKSNVKNSLSMSLDTSFSALCDLLSLMINDDNRNKEGSDRVGITALVARDSLIPTSITASVSRKLSNCVLGQEHTNAMALSCLRLFSNLLNDDKWRSGLSLGEDDEESSQPSQSIMNLSSAMMELRLSPNCTDALLLALDVTLSLLTQYSCHTRSALIRTSDFVKSVTDDVKYIVNHYALTNAERKGPQKKLGDGDDENNSISTSSTSKVSSATEKIRERSRGYMLNSKSSSTKTPVAKDPLTDAARLRLWSALVLLKSVCHGCEDIELFLHQLQIQHLLKRLLKMVSMSPAAISRNTSSSSSAVYHKARDAWTSWVPSDAHISAVVLALYASLGYNNETAKKAIASAGEPRVADKGTTKAGNTLHQLISLGLSPGIHQSFRRVCLALAGSLVKEQSSSLQQAKAQSSIVAKTLGVALYSLLKNNNSNLEDLVFVLDALSSCICNGQTIFSSGEPNRRAKGAIPSAEEKAFIVDMTDHTQLLSLPEFIKWVYEKHSKDDMVMAALLRMIGGIAEKGGKNKRILANIKGEESVKIIVDLIKSAKMDENRHEAVTITALMALWTLLHNNEATRGQLRKLQVDNQSLLGDDDETDFGRHRSIFADFASTVQFSDDDDTSESSIVTRAKKALTILLQ